jgi:Ca2+-binding EF-hand superfamily protein
MASNSASTLSRYRPAIWAIATCSIAVGFYLAYEAFRHQPAAAPPLHRSNAVYRRRRMPRAGQRESGEPGGEPAIRQLIDPDGTRNYGRYRIPAQDGSTHFIDLHLPRFPTLEELHQRYGLPGAQAQRTYNDIERTYIHRWIALNYPSHQPFHYESGHPDSEMEAMVTTLEHLGLNRENIEAGIERYNSWYNAGQPSEEIGLVDPARILQNGDMGDGADSIAGTEMDWEATGASGVHHPRHEREGQGLKQMLYYIAEHQSREDGYIHRGVTCNSCDIKPIRGIRWRCANCPDFDLCSDCEASNIHNKTHIFYKVKIPAPFLGNPRQTQPVVYPGKPKMMPRHLNNEQRTRFTKETAFEVHEVDALYDQFTCLADREYPQDPNELGAAIDRKAFDKAFVPVASFNTPQPNLIYDRMFGFYDTNSDGLIGFEEFLKGLACLHSKEKVSTRLKRVFEGYDLDADGFVCRKDFLRMFRAYYAIQKEIIRDLLAVQEAEDDLTIAGAMETIASSQPLSAAFTDALLPPGQTNGASGKAPNAFGDRRTTVPVGENSEDVGDRVEILGNAWELQEGYPFDPTTGDPLSSSHIPAMVVSDTGDIQTGEVSFSYQGHPIGEMRDEAVRDRWRRRKFYTDEEEGFEPPTDLFDEETPEKKNIPSEPQSPALRHMSDGSRPVSPRSRSSSKVRFQEDVDFETRSNASTSSRPFNERFGGYEIPQLEKDYGQETLYQVTQQGLNELLDPLFKKQEDRAIAVEQTAAARQKWRAEIDAFKERVREQDRRRQQEEQDPLLATATAAEAMTAPEVRAVDDVERHVNESELDDLLKVSGYSIIEDSGPTADAEQSTELSQPQQLPSQPDQTSDSTPITAAEPVASNAEVEAQEPAQDAPEPNHLRRDPTLPHHRPSSVSDIPSITLNGTDSAQASTSQSETPAWQRDRDQLLSRFAALVLGMSTRTAFQLPHGRWQIRRLSATHDHLEPPKPHKKPGNAAAADGAEEAEQQPPSEEQLRKYANLDTFEKQIRQRGGPGRLCYEEFEYMMRSENGRALGFLEGWLELGSF